MRFRSLGALSASAVLAMLVLAVSAAGASSAEGATGTYIVQMIQAPAATYTGGVAGIPATKPAKGKKFDGEVRGGQAVTSAISRRRTTRCSPRSVGRRSTTTTYTFNGFAATLTDA